MMNERLDPETRAALVRVIRRAAKRGREIRAQQDAVVADLAGTDDDGARNPAPMEQDATGSIHDGC